MRFDPKNGTLMTKHYRHARTLSLIGCHVRVKNLEAEKDTIRGAWISVELPPEWNFQTNSGRMAGVLIAPGPVRKRGTSVY